jgi:hypothetical protein
MVNRNGQHEQLILDTLRRHRTMTMEGLVTAVPDLSWNCVFQVIDELSRSGRIAVHRQGFDYELALPTSLPQSAPPAA